MATGYEDIDNLMNQQNNLLNEQQKKQVDLINQQTQIQTDELNYEKEKIDKDVNKTTSGLYTNWQKEANQYGVQAEQLAQQGLANSGYAETTKTALYNTYQKNVTDTLNNARDLKSDYDFKIAQARQQGSVQQAQAAVDLYAQKLQLLTQNYELKQNREQYLYQQERDKVSDNQWQKTFDEQVRQNEIENQWKQKNYDYQIQRDKVSDSQWQTSLDYQKSRDVISDKQWQQNFDYQKYRDNISDWQWKTSFDYQKYRNNVSDGQWQTSFDYQKYRDNVSDNQWQKQYELSKKASASSSKSSSRSTSTSTGKSSSSGGSLKVNNSDNTQSKQYTAKEVIANMKILQGPNTTGAVKDGISGKTFSSPDALLNYYGYVGVN